MNWEESALWRRTLSPAGANTEAHEKLRSAYLQMREAVKPVAEDIALSVRNYTDHGIDHSDSLWLTAAELVPEGFDINPAEAFVLGGAFLIHDLAMGLSAYSSGLPGILASTQWLDYLYASVGESAGELNEEAIAAAKDDPTWDGIASKEVKAALTGFLRENHAIQAGEMLATGWQLTGGEVIYLLQDAPLRQYYGAVIGKIARSHWMNVAQLEAYLPPELGPIPGMPSDWTVNPVKLACVLRLADAINVDVRRAHPLHTPHRQPQGDSKDHWTFQERMLLAKVREGRVVFTSASPFGPEFAAAWWLAYDTIQSIDEELRQVDNMFSDLGLTRFAATGVAGADSAARFSRFVQTVDWVPIDGSPYIGDPRAVMERLGGSALYGNGEPLVALRELLANAFDASRAYDGAFADQGVLAKPVIVDYQRTDDGDTLRVRDFGIGIMRDSVVKKLCNFGTSGWKDSESRNQLPGLMSSGYKPTGRFGIGFFSVFMVADDVKVVTRHVEAAKSDTTVLEFTGGLSTRPVMRAASRTEQLLEPGTEILLKLREPADADFDGVFSDLWSMDLSSANIARVVEKLTLTSDQELLVRSGNGPWVRVGTGASWRDAPGADLFDRLNPFADKSDPRIVQMRQNFDLSLRPIRDRSNAIIGRAGLPVFELSGFHPWIDYHGSYCGGLASDGTTTFNFIGIMEGEPNGAARRQVDLEVEVGELRRWFNEQLDILRLSDDVPRDDFRVATFGHEIGVEVQDFPVAFVNSSYVNVSELRAWLASVSEISVIEGSASPIDLDGKRINLFASDDALGLIELPDGVLVIDEYYFGRDSLGADFDWLELSESERELSDHKELMAWWRKQYAKPIGMLVKSIASAWGISLIEAARSINHYGYSPDGTDERPSYRALGGEQVRVRGWRALRPHYSLQSGNV